MLPSNTTLINPKSSAQSSNPNVYAANRNQHFESLRGQAAVKAEQSVDITRNARVGYYLSQYNKLKQQLNQQEREQKATISSDSFDTIFSKKITKFEQQQQQKSEAQRLRDSLFESYTNMQSDNLEQTIEEVPRSLLANRELTHLLDYRTDEYRKKELYMIDLQIGRMHQDKKLAKKVNLRQQSCTNNKLLGRLSSTIISSYMVHFEDIYRLLLDDLLEEEVIFMNKLQAEYRLGIKGGTMKEEESLKTMRMRDLVRCLDELCDQ